MNCKNCGTQLVPGQIVCSNCDFVNEDLNNNVNNVTSNINSYDDNINSNVNFISNNIFWYIFTCGILLFLFCSRVRSKKCIY